MIKTIVLFLGVVGFTSGCGSATFSAQDGSYKVAGRSNNPEAMAATLSQNRAREMNAETYREAVLRGQAMPYMGGMSGDYRRHFCPNGVCIGQPVAPVMAAPPASGAQAPAAPVAQTAPAAAKEPTVAPAKPAENPVSKAELAETNRRAEEALKRANVALTILQEARPAGE